ncbi:TIGR04086 family membrane protein [Anaerosalibacter massiliensis]|uniref:TIGR04086 family membrane protein n=1 Tax=Anaerosalibacter massiliensis TaxID=1347392 RepID=A0A9X2S3T1_9FIRM|nr:TIGR04086 family membrane protein [Anaerosalibacter massiliensis]MCR2042524.1 TIGR04086 family membrane protein [Anaerosalibacter massiliensis]
MDIKKTDYALHILKGIAISYIITIIMLTIVSLLLTYTSLKESSIPILSTIIIIVSIALGAIYLTLKIGEKGWLNGAIIGILYFLILIILKKIFLKEFGLNIYFISKLIISLITGIIGGMIGINLE